MKRATSAIHAGVKKSDPTFGSVVPPIYPSSTYTFADTDEGARRFAGEAGMVYARWTNPTVQALEERICAIEGKEACVATASGMSAITMPLLHILQKGDHILAHPVLYGGTFDFINRCLPRFGVEVTLTDLTDPEEVRKNIKPNTKIVYFETPTNPTMEVLDVAAIVAIAKENNCLTMVDATFAPRPMQDNASMGVDIIAHSLTKYMGGHSDLIGGAVLGSSEFIKDLRKNSMTVYGPTLSPFTAYLVMRGITTMDIRIEKINKNAAIIADYLHNHPKIEKVFYPTLASHPQHKLAKKQMPGGCGAVMSFCVKGGYEPAKKMANSIKIFSLAVSLGGVESLIQHPASMTHSKMTEAEREKTGINSALIRISVGIEDVEDLKQALDDALKNA